MIRIDEPIHESRHGKPSIYSLWFKNGQDLTWTQRTGFAMFSLALFASGLLFDTLAINSIRNEYLMSIDTLGAVCAIVAGLCFLIFGLLGLRSVLRF
jgi:hypothetical protein